MTAARAAVLSVSRTVASLPQSFRVNGRREREIVHERRDCDCGCGGDWTQPKARAELANVLARLTVGV